MTIRPATKQDLKPLQALMDQLNKIRSSHFSKETKLFHKRKKAYSPLSAKDLKTDIFLVAEDNNTLIGYISGSMHKRKSHYLSALGYISELFVMDAYRKKGLASKLAKMLQKELKKRGCDHMTTMTDQENLAAQGFYESIGMKRVTVEFWKKL